MGATLNQLVRALTDHDRSRLGLSANELATLLGQWLERAQKAWPGIAVPPKRFVEHLGPRIPEEQKGRDGFCVEELYLCCGCLLAVPAAAETFIERYRSDVQQGIRRMRIRAPLADDIEQDLLQRLLVADGARRPMLANYKGRGALGRWLAVAAARTATRHLQRVNKLVPMDLPDVPEQLVGAEHAAIQGPLKHSFKKAFKRALEALDAADANVLRFRYIDGLNLEAIAEIQGVHLTTIHRRLSRIRATLERATREILAAELGVGEQDCLSVIRNLQENFDITLRTFMGERKAR